MDWLSHITGISRLPTKTFFAASLITGAMLFLPETLLTRLHVQTIIKQYGAYVGIVFIASLAIVVTNVVAWCLTKIAASRETAKRNARTIEYLSRLDAQEQSVLREFLFGGQQTIKLPMDHPTIAGLIENSVIQKVGSYGERSLVGLLFSFKLSDTAGIYMSPKILGLVGGYLVEEENGQVSISDEGLHWARNNRPQFMAEIKRHGRVSHGM